jgi:KUP system potassium uptake protein
MNSNETRQGLGLLTLGALGVVYGDIGTSPLYTMKEVFNPAHGVPLDAPNVIGAVSVIFWALTALAAAGTPARRTLLLLTGVLGAALFYGDSVITPAISVLGAVEGLESITPTFKPFVLPISVAIIVALFMVQRFGTGAVGKLFGPIITVWFVVLGVMGVLQVVQLPGILAALNPLQAVAFLQARGWHLFLIMGSIVLALTGAEALYADMGHFGARPIRIACTGLVLPSLALN